MSHTKTGENVHAAEFSDRDQAQSHARTTESVQRPELGGIAAVSRDISDYVGNFERSEHGQQPGNNKQPGGIPRGRSAATGIAKDDASAGEPIKPAKSSGEPVTLSNSGAAAWPTLRRLSRAF